MKSNSKNKINSDNFFRLDDEFFEKYRNRQPSWGPLGYFTYKRTYARYIEKENRKEEFWETIRRVVEGCFTIQKDHCMKLKLLWNETTAKIKAQIMYDKIWNFKMLPPGRGLWIMGTEFVTTHGSMALNNCGFVSTKDLDINSTKAFEFLMDALMHGVGVGFDTKGANSINIKQPKGHFIYKIPDSRKGWVNSLKYLLKAYFYGENLPEYDFSLIRPSGDPIRSYGGIAPGYEPLKKMLKNIDKILSSALGKSITAVNILDIMNQIGVCVVAGGVRRSAEIALGNLDDKDFILSKQNIEMLYTHRWVSNNSIIAEIGMDYSFVAEQIAKNGEPGIFWLENAKSYSRMMDPPDFKDKNALGTNPCGEQTLESFELCCLVETYPSKHDSYEEFQDTLKYAYLYAKSVTLLHTHWKETNDIIMKNRRIGISQSGIVEAFKKLGTQQVFEWCRKGYHFLKNLDEKYSEWLSIPKSIKLTTVKPSGTVSLLPGVSHGIHYPHAEYYIRRIRISKNSDLVDLLKKSGYSIVDDMYSDSNYVIEFPVHKKNVDRTKNDVSIWEQAENAEAYQKYWSDNQVSITITFKPEEVKDIKNLLESYQDKLKGVSFLPLEEHDYKQAPYEKITELEYHKLKKNLKPLELRKSVDRSRGSEFCDSAECEIIIKRQ